MFRRIAAVLILTGLTTGPSLAESFKGVRCEDPKVIAILEEQIKSPFIGGRSFLAYPVDSHTH